MGANIGGYIVGQLIFLVGLVHGHDDVAHTDGFPACHGPAVHQLALGQVSINSDGINILRSNIGLGQ